MQNSGGITGGIFGGTLMLWICIQFYMFPLNFMSTAFFVIGFCQAATGYAAWVFDRQEQFVVQESDIRTSERTTNGWWSIFPGWAM